MLILFIYQITNPSIVLLELVLMLLLCLQEFIMEFLVLVIKFINTSVYLLI